MERRMEKVFISAAAFSSESTDSKDQVWPSLIDGSLLTGGNIRE